MKKLFVLLALSLVLFGCKAIEDQALERLDEIGEIIRTENKAALEDAMKDFAKWTSNLNYEDSRKVDEVAEYWIDTNPQEGLVLSLYVMSEWLKKAGEDQKDE